MSAAVAASTTTLRKEDDFIVFPFDWFCYGYWCEI
jgi:hypothetical protein